MADYDRWSGFFNISTNTERERGICGFLSLKLKGWFSSAGKHDHRLLYTFAFRLIVEGGRWASVGSNRESI